uniref:Uncharacterized protein n=1 Tax=viral metagenome TaxID=1070528 RepID=A0A6M3IRY5_9ZZZZ
MTGKPFWEDDEFKEGGGTFLQDTLKFTAKLKSWGIEEGTYGEQVKLEFENVSALTADNEEVTQDAGTLWLPHKATIGGKWYLFRSSVKSVAGCGLDDLKGKFLTIETDPEYPYGKNVGRAHFLTEVSEIGGMPTTAYEPEYILSLIEGLVRKGIVQRSLDEDIPEGLKEKMMGEPEELIRIVVEAGLADVVDGVVTGIK